MRLLLVFLIAVVAAGGFYEYHENEVQVLDYTREREEIAAHIVKLKKENKDLQDEQGVLKEKLAYLQKQSGDLKTQLANLPVPGTNAPSATPPAPAP